MEYDYNFGNDYYKYYCNTGVKITVYKILAPEQSPSVHQVIEYLMNPLPIFNNLKYVGAEKIPC